jgi:F-type H+-transporting ATPase subunit gamma
MSQSLNKVKRRIGAINSTRKVTSAMKLVSNVKTRRYSRELDMQTAYINSMEQILNDCVFINHHNGDEKVDSIYLKENDKSNKTLYLIYSSTLGLCGGFNNELFRFFRNIYKEGDELVLIGEKSLHEYRDQNIKLYTDFIKLNNSVNKDCIDGLAKFLVDKYQTGDYKSVHFIYHDYVNSMVSVPKDLQILPILLKENDEYAYDPVFCPDKEAVIKEVVSNYIKSILYQKMYASLVSENSARRTAMDNADQNAKDMIDKLQLEYNKARQAAITQELTEVVAGSKDK